MAQSLSESLLPVSMDEWPEDPTRLSAGEDFADLLEELTGRDQDLAEVDDNVSRVFASPNAELLVVRHADRIISTATLSANPILRGEGVRLWIDDVVTAPDEQGRGHSKRVMNAIEEMAAELGSEVYLTSAAHRGPARAGYEKRGYTLLNETSDPLVVYRSTTIGKAVIAPEVDAQILGSNFTVSDTFEIGSLLDEGPDTVAHNLEQALQSPTTRVYVTRGENDNITGVAVANETPIPVGKKPWIDDIAGSTPEDVTSVVLAAGTWLGSNYKHVNIVAPPDSAYGEGFTQRDSGLYVKQLGGSALRAS